MISTKELRIGNFVEFRHRHRDGGETNTIISVEAISVCEVGVVGKGVTVSSNDIHPIQLTREVIEACGADISHTEYVCKASNMRVCYDTAKIHAGDIEFCLYRDDSDDVFVLSTEGDLDFVKISSLHQLQNLIFTLSGEELAISCEQLNNAPNRNNKRK